MRQNQQNTAAKNGSFISFEDTPPRLQERRWCVLGGRLSDRRSPRETSPEGGRVKVSIATSAKQEAAFADTAIEADVSHDASVKADKLEVNYIEEAPDKKLVRSITIVLPPVAAPKPREKITKIISRHWHEGYAKMTPPKHDRRKTSKTKRGK
jgi:hypothetical protein